MMKNEIKTAIDNEAANLKNGGYVFSTALTSVIFQGEIPYDLADGNETYEVDGDEVVKVGVFLTKDRNGNVTIIVDNGSCYSPTYTAEEFAEVYSEDFAETAEEFAEVYSEDFAETSGIC